MMMWTVPAYGRLFAHRTLLKTAVSSGRNKQQYHDGISRCCIVRTTSGRRQLQQQAMAMTFSSSTSSKATTTVEVDNETTTTSQTTMMKNKKQQQQQQQQQQPRRRRRSRQQQGNGVVDDDDDNKIDSPSFIDMDAVPSLKDFMHRHTVLSMYRGFLQSVRYLRSDKDGGNYNPVMADELLNEIRREFRAQKHETDPFQRQRAIADGQRRAEELRGLTGEPDVMTTKKKKSKNTTTAALLQQEDADSWINIVDPEDQRGRVGSGWPWAK
jgi:hypothetical protein